MKIEIEIPDLEEYYFESSCPEGKELKSVFIRWERKTHYPWVVGYKRP